MDGGYGPTLDGLAEQLAPHCDARDLSRLVQLVEMAYAFEPAATTRVDRFVALVEQQRVESPSTAPVRVMNYHQVKGLQFDIAVLPELDFQMRPQTPKLVVGRAGPAEPIDHVCRYLSKKFHSLLPKRLADAFEEHDRAKAEEALCILYVALTRSIHSMWCVVAPSAKNEKTMPGTAAGVLREALTEGAPAEPETVLFEHGDPGWYAKAQADGLIRVPAGSAEAEVEPLTIELAPAGEHAHRGMERVSPSGLEGGRRVQLAATLNVEAGAALERGSVMHAWMEQIEWLEDGLPDDAQLGRIAQRSNLDAAAIDQLKREFHAALGRPEIAASLSRAYYKQADDGSCAVCAAAKASPRWQVWRERPFALREEGAIVNGTIDRLTVLYDGPQVVGADILDFKTDHIPPGDPAALAVRVAYSPPQPEPSRHAVPRQFRLDLSKVSARLAFLSLGAVVGV